MKRIVKLVAHDNRYKERTYPHRCVFDEAIKTYITGQHIDPRDPSTAENLTVDEMTGKVPLSPAKMKKFPFVINPEHVIKFRNGKLYNVSVVNGEYVNPADAAHENLLRKHAWYTAKSRKEVKPKTHYFYLYDEVHEAEKRVEEADRAYKAEKIVREDLTSEGIFDLSLVLRYKLKEFDFDPNNYTDLLLKDKVLDVCRKKPDIIISASTKGLEDDIFAMKLVFRDILKLKGTDFYDGAEFFAANLQDFRKEIKKEQNQERVSKWYRLLSTVEGRNSETTYAGPNAGLLKAEAIYNDVKDLDVDEIKKYCGSKRYKKEEWEPLQTKEELIKYLLAKYQN